VKDITVLTTAPHRRLGHGGREMRIAQEWGRLDGMRLARTVLPLVVALACAHEPQERCRLITEHVPTPELPSGFAQVDHALLQRAICTAQEVRRLQGSLARSFRIYFSEETLPLLCGRLELARQLALSGRTREAGLKYQALMVASQVLDLAVALHVFSEYADSVGVPSGRIDEAQELFVEQLGPIFEAALGEDPVQMQRALALHAQDYAEWVDSFGRWSSQVAARTPAIAVARLVWDGAMLVVATHDAATATADLAAMGRPPMPPLPALAFAEGAGAGALSEASYVELAEALRRLIACGALDAAVVAGLSSLSSRGIGDLQLPTTLQMAGPLSINQMNAQIQRGQAPKGITRIDRGKVPGEQDHAHLGEDDAINKDGTWKHGGMALTGEQQDWLRANGWNIPEEHH